MLAAGFIIDHRSWAPGRKTDIDPATLAADRAWTPATTQEDDDVSYTDWPAADRQALLDDLWRMLKTGRKIDGTTAQQLTDLSDQSIKGLVNLVRVGDDPEPAGGDTHPENLRTLSAAVAAVDRKLDKVIEGLPVPPPPGA